MEMKPIVDEDDVNDVEDFRLDFSDEVEGKLWKAAGVAEKSEWRKVENKQNHRRKKNRKSYNKGRQQEQLT